MWPKENGKVSKKKLTFVEGLEDFGCRGPNCGTNHNKKKKTKGGSPNRPSSEKKKKKEEKKGPWCL